MSNKEIKNTLNKLYIIHKKKLNKNYVFSNSYYDLEDAINSYFRELSCPPPITEEKEEEDIKKKSLELLQELNVFIHNP